MKNKLLIIVITVLSFYCFKISSAQPKDMPDRSPAGGLPCPPEMRMQKAQPVIHATDWVDAWQMAKQACTNANSLAIQLVDRSGPSLQTPKIFECVDLKASGELLIITVKKADKPEESVIIIRSPDMLRIEITKRVLAQE